MNGNAERIAITWRDESPPVMRRTAATAERERAQTIFL